MKRLIITAAALVVCATFTTPAQQVARNTGAAGSWRFEAARLQDSWTAVLNVEGSTVWGAVSSCASIAPAQIIQGFTDGRAVRFRCTSADGDRSLSFSGTLDGDSLVLQWTKQIREAGFDRPADAIFGRSSSGSLTVTRTSDPSDAVVTLAATTSAPRQVDFDRIRRTREEPHNWLTYSGTLDGSRHSRLSQVTPDNVASLEIAWLWQSRSTAQFEATPIVADGVLYSVVANDVVALDAGSGRELWTHRHTGLPSARASGGGGRPNRGLAILGDRLFLGTLDAHLVAIHAHSGHVMWDVTVANAADPSCQGSYCYVITHAPLVVKDMVIVGVGGGDGTTRGFIAAYDAATGRQRWRVHTIPGDGEPGNETWAGDSWRIGGGGVWTTGSYDPDLNLTYWGVGNPNPMYDGSSRAGDNLYTNSVVALEADTGRLRWHYQFTPHDERDWDAAHTPVLVDATWQGKPRRLLLSANKNGLMYLLDRTTGQFLAGNAFAQVNWMTGFDEKGRPIRSAPWNISVDAPVWPGAGATNWYPSSYDPGSRWFFIPVWERPAGVRGAIVRGSGYGAIRAFDPVSAERKWEFKVEGAIFTSGVLTTVSRLLFAGVSGDAFSDASSARLVNGNFYAIQSDTGRLLWRTSLAGPVTGSPVSYSVNGRQYIAVAAGNTLFTFALRQ